MPKIVLAIWLVLLAMHSFAASDNSGVMAAVHQIVDGFNKGDAAMFLGSCDKETAIVDEVPPHEWHGPDGCAQWMKDYGAFVERENIEDAVTTLGKTHRIQVSGSYAYVVMSATCDYRQKNKPVQKNGVVTLSLHKVERLGV